MASIPEHIKNLLFEQDCVVVPDFGGFITNFHGAVFRNQDASMLPPRKRVAFNEVLKFDDGLLISYIAFKEGLSREEVRSKIRSFTEKLWRELRFHSSFRLEHLGSFTLNAEGKLVFEPDHRINFFGESYGMVPISLRLRKGIGHVMNQTVVTKLEPVQESVLEVVPEEVDDNGTILLNSRQRWLTFPNVAASAALILFSLVGWVWFDKGNAMLGSLNPIPLFTFSGWNSTPPTPAVVSKTALRVEDVESKSTPATKTELLPAVPSAPEISSSGVVTQTHVVSEVIRNVLVIPMRVRRDLSKISAEPGRYFVIAGGFGKKANAQRLQKKLQAQGFVQATLLYPVKSRLIRVAVQEFDSPQNARQVAAESRGVLGDHVWVLKTK